jgi:hypothetical protein
MLARRESIDGQYAVMRTGLSLLFSLAVCACEFQSAPAPPAVSPAPPADPSQGDGAASVSDTAVVMPDARIDAAVAVDAAPPASDAASPDAGPFTRDDSGTDPDSGAPTDPPDPPQVGGLKCADVFCPFADQPLEPCCTAAADVEHGAARAEDRCGLNFAATGSDFYGDLCWQGDQPGVVDESCPAVSVDLRSEEPGCCSDQGQCGGLDSEHSLGCHIDPLATAVQSCGGPPPDAGTEEMCDLRGVFALRAEVDLSWGGRSGGLWDLTDDGRGKLVIHMLANFDRVDASTLELGGMVKPCGVELPPFYSTTLCEAYQPLFPVAMWESSEMPTFPVTGHLSCLTPGCIASIEAQTVLLGIELENPEAPWPTAQQTPDLECASGSGMHCFPDHDGDDRPGLTVRVATQGMLNGGTGCSRNGYELNAAPLRSSVAAIFGGVRRTDRILLGVRMRIGGSVALAGEQCESGVGSGVAEFVNSRAWGCVAQRGSANYPNGDPAGANEPCTSQEAAFMDANLPVYDILAVGQTPDEALELADTSASLGPRFSLVRLGASGATPSCADVRAAMQP